MKWLSVNKRYDYLTLSTLYNVFDGSAPKYMLDSFSCHKHTYQTRNATNSFILPHVKTNGHNSYRFNSIKLWNSLPFTPSESKDVFKNNCKLYLIDVMKREDDCEFVY